MPLRKGKRNIGRNIRELHHGKTYRRTKRKFGKRRADRQAIAISLRQSRERS